jgi:hypothetical protein
VICFIVVWALQLLIIQRGMETVRKIPGLGRTGRLGDRHAGAGRLSVRQGRRLLV